MNSTFIVINLIAKLIEAKLLNTIELHTLKMSEVGQNSYFPNFIRPLFIISKLSNLYFKSWFDGDLSIRVSRGQASDLTDQNDSRKKLLLHLFHSICVK